MIVKKISNYNSSRYASDQFTDQNKLDSDIKNYDTDFNTVFNCLQGRVTYGQNIAGEYQTVADTGTINTEFSISHTLGSVPTGYLVMKINKGGVIYDSGTTWTSTKIYLKCSAANATVRIFLIP